MLIKKIYCITFYVYDVRNSYQIWIKQEMIKLISGHLHPLRFTAYTSLLMYVFSRLMISPSIRQGLNTLMSKVENVNSNFTNGRYSLYTFYNVVI